MYCSYLFETIQRKFRLALNILHDWHVNRCELRIPEVIFYFHQHFMRIIYGLGTIEFISGRSVDVRIRFLLVGDFTSDI